MDLKRIIDEVLKKHYIEYIETDGEF